MKFKFIQTRDPEYSRELILRWETLRKPLGLPPGSELCEGEKESLHLIAIERKDIVGCVVFHPLDANKGELRQLAFSSDYHGRGFGRQMLTTLENSLVGKGFKEIQLYAGMEWVDFYLNMGYALQESEEAQALPMQKLMFKRL